MWIRYRRCDMSMAFFSVTDSVRYLLCRSQQFPEFFSQTSAQFLNFSPGIAWKQNWNTITIQFMEHEISRTSVHLLSDFGFLTNVIRLLSRNNWALFMP